MSTAEIVFSKKAVKEYDNLQKRALSKIDTIIKDIEKSPTSGGTGKVERLKGYDGIRYSRRVDEKNRLIYDYFEEEHLVVIVSFLGHHGDH